MSRLLLLIPALLLSACSTLETDRSSNDRQALAHTRVDFAPLVRSERDKLLQYEKYVLDKNVAPLEKELEELKSARGEHYDQIKSQFPVCENQKHCVSTLAHGNVKDFERYTELMKSLGEYDVKIVDAMTNLHNWKLRYELRTRSIVNRFLVNEILLLPKVNKRILKVTVHSLEAFDSRRPLSQRLLRLADFDAVAASWGDLNFHMLGKPVDEAAVLATYDVLVLGSEPTKERYERYLVNFLVNVQKPDQLGYELGFLQHWADLFVEPAQKSLREMALCSLYSIAGETLAAKLAADKAKLCALERNRHQVDQLADHIMPEEWLIPLSYARLTAAP